MCDGFNDDREPSWKNIAEDVLSLEIELSVNSSDDLSLLALDLSAKESLFTVVFAVPMLAHACLENIAKWNLF